MGLRTLSLSQRGCRPRPGRPPLCVRGRVGGGAPDRVGCGLAPPRCPPRSRPEGQPGELAALGGRLGRPRVYKRRERAPTALRDSRDTWPPASRPARVPLLATPQECPPPSHSLGGLCFNLLAFPRGLRPRGGAADGCASCLLGQRPGVPANLLRPRVCASGFCVAPPVTERLGSGVQAAVRTWVWAEGASRVPRAPARQMVASPAGKF